MPIQYPRQCEHCDYISNNPSMYHYHKRTHEPVPVGTLCNHGCGQFALFKGTGGKYTCLKNSFRCPAYTSTASNRTKKQWEGATERRILTRQSIIKHLHNEDTVKKSSRTKREKFGTLDPIKAKEYRHYARFIRQRAQHWAKTHGYELGQQTLHVDHKLSILDAWHAGLPESIVNHPANLQIISAKKNTSKGAKSLMTVEELLEMINPSS